MSREIYIDCTNDDQSTEKEILYKVTRHYRVHLIGDYDGENDKISTKSNFYTDETQAMNFMIDSFANEASEKAKNMKEYISFEAFIWDDDRKRAQIEIRTRNDKNLTVYFTCSEIHLKKVIID